VVFEKGIIKISKGTLQRLKTVYYLKINTMFHYSALLDLLYCKHMYIHQNSTLPTLLVQMKLRDEVSVLVSSNVTLTRS